MTCACIIAYAIGLHLTWAMTLSVAGDAGYTTATIAGHDLLGFVYPPLLLMSAVVGIICLDRGLSARCFLLAAIPQQIFLTLSAVTAVNAIYGGAYPDGVVRTGAFLLVDQAPALLAAVFHGAAMVEGYVGRSESGAELLPTPDTKTG